MRVNRYPDQVVEEIEEDGGQIEYEPPEAPLPLPSVPSYLAIIRIVCVLAMGLSISFGLFIMLVGVDGVLVGVPLILFSVPCYLAMRLAERLVLKEDHRDNDANATNAGL